MANLPKLIVGLGNPGPEYVRTRHNVGFMVVDRLLAGLKVSAAAAEHKFSSELYRTRHAGRGLYLAKPLTFMNISGQAVVRMVRVLDVAPDELIIIYDCLDLPLGRLRLRPYGSSGGHRGMESIIDSLGTDRIPRLRVGIGRSSESTVVDHVLTSWTEQELPIVEAVLETASAAVLYAVRRGVSAAMNEYNGWDAPGSADMSEKDAEL